MAGLEDALSRLIEDCSLGPEECRQATRRLLEEQCRDPTRCEQPRPRGRRARLLEKYRWVEELIRKGVPDGRSRLILYIISRYLVNVKGLDPEEAHTIIREFIENSCRNHGNCTKIYDSWIRNVLRRVKEGGWLPWSLERTRERDPELHDIIKSIIDQ